MTKLLIEALVVGITAAFAGIVISTLFMLPRKDFNWKKYDFWPQILASFFLTGFILHLSFEWLGANKWYCKHGNACNINL